MVERFFMESSKDKPDDEKFLLYGVTWLTKQNEKAILYLPVADRIESSYFSKLYSKEMAKEFRKNMCMTFGDKKIDIISDRTVKPTSELVNVFVVWADDNYDKMVTKIEESYNINSILVLPWNPETDIKDWKTRHNPTQLFLD